MVWQPPNQERNHLSLSLFNRVAIKGEVDWSVEDMVFEKSTGSLVSEKPGS
jgi:hypothetical protein